MELSQLDKETKAVLVLAHIVARRPSEDNLGRLRHVLEAFDAKHAEERATNLIRVLFEDLRNDDLSAPGGSASVTLPPGFRKGGLDG